MYNSGNIYILKKPHNAFNLLHYFPIFVDLQMIVVIYVFTLKIN